MSKHDPRAPRTSTEFGVAALIPNTQLRDYVQRSAFDLNLGRTHIAALIYIELCIRNRQRVRTPRVPGSSVWGMFVPAAGGLERRGLLLHHYTPKKDKRGYWIEQAPSAIWTITKAGRLVLGLLKEAGLYDEYASQLIVVEKSA